MGFYVKAYWVDAFVIRSSECTIQEVPKNLQQYLCHCVQVQFYFNSMWSNYKVNKSCFSRTDLMPVLLKHSIGSYDIVRATNKTTMPYFFKVDQLVNIFIICNKPDKSLQSLRKVFRTPCILILVY